MGIFDQIVLPDMKRGETFEFTVHFNNAGASVDMSVDDVRCEVRAKSSGKLLEECTKEQVDTSTIKFTVTDTDEWPIGDIEFDVDYTINDIKYSTPTYTRKVLKDITRPG